MLSSLTSISDLLINSYLLIGSELFIGSDFLIDPNADVGLFSLWQLLIAYLFKLINVYFSKPAQPYL